MVILFTLTPLATATFTAPPSTIVSLMSLQDQSLVEQPIPSTPPILSPSPAPAQLWNASLGDPFQGFSAYQGAFKLLDIAVAGNDVFLTGTYGDHTSNNTRAFLASHSAATGALNWRRYDISDPAFMTQGYRVATNGTTVFVSGTSTTQAMPSEMGIFLGAYDTQSGTRHWYTNYNSSSMEGVYGLALNGSALYLTGSWANETSWNNEALLAKFDANTGIQLWNTTFATTTYTTGMDVAVNGSAVYISGTNATSGFVARYTASGNEVWNTSLGEYNMPLGMAANTSGLYISGYQYDPMISMAIWNGTLWKMTSDGIIQWKQNLANVTAYDVAVDGAAVYLLGLQSTGPLVGLNLQISSFLARFDSTGTQLWNTTYDTTSPDLAWSLAASNGEIFYVGNSYTYLYPPMIGNVQANTLGMDYFLVKHDDTGSFQWDQEERAHGVEFATNAVIGRGGLYVTGSEKKTKKDTDLFLALYSFDGSLQWKTTLTSPLNEEGHAITITRNQVYVAGIQYTEGIMELLLVCFDLQGTHLWTATRDFEDMGYFINHQAGIAMTETNDVIYIVGTLVNATMPMSFGDAGFLIGFSAVNGAYLWNTTWESQPYNTQVGGIARSPTQLYVTYTNFTDTALLCFDLNGTQQWITEIKEVNAPTSVAVNASLIYVAGKFHNISNGDYDAFLGAYNTAGTHQWNTTWSHAPITMFPDQATGIAVGTDEIYLIGTTLDYNLYKGNTWITSFDTMGVHQWNITLTDQHYDYLYLFDIDIIDGTLFTVGAAQKARQNYGHEIDAIIAAYGSGWSGLADLIVHIEDTQGNPIAGADVSSSTQPTGQSPLAGVTNATGHVEFNNIIPGFYTIEVTATNYLQNDESPTVNPGETKIQTVTLQGIGTIIIEVTDTAGTLLAGINLVSTSQPTGQDALAGTTGSDGSYTFSAIYLGTYTIEASHANYFTNSITLTLTAAGDTETTIIPLQPRGIPGFPWEAILLGLILVIIPVIILRRRRVGSS